MSFRRKSESSDLNGTGFRVEHRMTEY